jgi:hypothetical protein
VDIAIERNISDLLGIEVNIHPVNSAIKRIRWALRNVIGIAKDVENLGVKFINGLLWIKVDIQNVNIVIERELLNLMMVPCGIVRFVIAIG